MVNHVGWGKDTDSQHDTFGRPSWVSHLPAGPHLGLQSFQYDQIFSIQLFVTREDDNAIFSIPGNTLMSSSSVVDISS